MIKPEYKCTPGYEGKGLPLSKGMILGQSNVMKEVFDDIQVIASTPFSISISGETGTGKELVARAIHDYSNRRNGPFVAVNCAAIPENLFESEFFGHGKGAFTGAEYARRGIIEQAEGGTLLLDEITKMSLYHQQKLLRALEGGYNPVGSNKTKIPTVRLITSDSTSLEDALNRKDNPLSPEFYYRMKGTPVHLPPLRERNEDIELLAVYFCEKYAAECEIKIKLGDEAIELFNCYGFQGNVRQLQYFIKSAIARNPGGEQSNPTYLEEKHILEAMSDFNEGPSGLSLKAVEERAIIAALNRAGGHRDKAAEILGIEVRTLRNKMIKYDLRGRFPAKNGHHGIK